MYNMNKIKTPSVTPEETARSIVQSMRPVCALCKILGLSVVKTKNGFSSEKLFPYFHFALYLSVYTTLTVYSLVTIATSSGDFIVANKYIVFAECSVITTLMLVVLIFTFLFRNVQMKALELLAQIDVCFIKNGFSLQYKNLLKKNYVILGVTTLSLILRMFAASMVIHATVVQHLTVYLATAIKTFSKYQFVVFVLQLQMRFTKINSGIRSFYKDSRVKLILNPHVKAVPEKLYLLCRLHYKLAHVMEKLNSAFSVQLLVSTAVSLFDVLFQSYYLYFVAMGKSPDVGGFMVLCPMVWLLDETIEIYWLVHACANTCDQANETPTILHELRNSYCDVDLENHIQTYSLQMLHQKVQFSVLGFFVVDYTLIYSIGGAVTTYLVIFIQFDQSSNSQSNNDTHTAID